MRRPSRSLLDPARKAEFTEPVGMLAAFSFDESKVKRDQGRFSTKDVDISTGGQASEKKRKELSEANRFAKEGEKHLKLWSDWFDGSVIVDGVGEPLTVYHGGKIDGDLSADNGVGEFGIYVSPRKEYARKYGPTTPFHVSMKNPKIIEGKHEINPGDLTKEDASRLIRHGFDGIVVLNKGQEIKDASEIVVFNGDAIQETFRRDNGTAHVGAGDSSAKFSEPIGILSDFDESKVKREGRGNEGGGRFTKSASGSAEPLRDPKKEKKPKKASPGSQLPQDVLDRFEELGVKEFPEIESTEIKIHDLNGDDVHTRAVATWRNKKGKLKHAYTEKFHADNAAAKWKRVKALDPKLEEMRAELNRKVKEGEFGSREHQGALIAAIIAETGLRPGNSTSAKDGHYGISTLLPEHGLTGFGIARLRFIGKSGKENTTVLETPELVAALGEYAKKAKHGQIFEPSALNSARRSTPGGVKLKDFRTVIAGRVARSSLADLSPPPPPMPEKGGKKLVRSILKKASNRVADRLNNTPAVAKSSYIHPEIFKLWGSSRGVPEELMS